MRSRIGIFLLGWLVGGAIMWVITGVATGPEPAPAPQPGAFPTVSRLHAKSEPEGEHIEAPRIARIYDVRDLLPPEGIEVQAFGGSHGGRMTTRERAQGELVMFLADTADAESWIVNGGERGEMRIWDGRLLVFAVQPAHDQVRWLLSEMRAAAVRDWPVESGQMHEHLRRALLDRWGSAPDTQPDQDADGRSKDDAP